MKKKLKKPMQGTIEVSSTIKGDDYYLVVRDDGSGLKLDKLRESIKRMNKYSDDEIKSWDKQQLANTVFASGVSTVDETNILAGRGIGLDAIKENIEKKW